jgi:PAS domain S-box-containing protein
VSGDLPPDAYEELVGHAVDVITVVDESGVIQYESPSIRRVLGFEPEELVGEVVFDYVHPDDRRAALDTFREIVESGTADATGAVELRFRCADGSWRWVESRGINRTASAIGGYVVTSRDIGERKAHERRLQRENDRLERFAGVVSHDLRNPLGAAAGHLELAREECESEHLDAVGRSLDRMDELIDDVLALVREGRRRPLLDAVDLRTVAEESWAGVETAAATLSVETDRAVVADESQLRQLLGNLFHNAVEHGGEDVTVTVAALEDGFAVADDGGGLAAGARDSLFEYGFSTKADGTGLGLSIVTEIADNHGWSVTVTDAADGGTRFEVRGVTVAE